jgi:hypothetical protein
MSTYTGPTTLSGNGTITSFSFTWGYLEDNDVKVYVNGVLKTLGTDYNLNTPGTVAFGTAPANGASVQISRITDTAYEVYTGPLNNSDLNKTAVHGPYMAEEAKASLAAAGTFVGGMYDTNSEAALATVPSTADAIHVLGAAAAGDGGAGIYKRVSVQPAHNAKIQSGTQWWELAPRFDVEKVDLEYFLKRWADPREAFVEAMVNLYNNGSKRPRRLECDGIPLKFQSPLQIKDTVVINGRTYTIDFDATSRTDSKRISGLNVKLDNTGTYTWVGGDYLLSFLGNQITGNIQNLTIEHPVIDMNNVLPGGGAVYGLHVTGYYHLPIIHPVILNCKGVGIISTRFGQSSGRGAQGRLLDGSDASDNTNHGLKIIEPDISDTGSSTAPSIGIYLEDGDAVIEGGWISNVQTGLYSTKGGFNIFRTHFSMDNNANQLVAGQMKNAILCTSPHDMILKDLECDGSGFLFTDYDGYDANLSALTNWADIILDNNHHTIKSGVSGSAPASGYGVVTFETQNANQVPNNLQAGAAFVSGTAACEYLKWRTVAPSGGGATGSWDYASARKFAGKFWVPQNGGVNMTAGDPGVDHMFVRTNQGSMVWERVDATNARLRVTNNSGDAGYVKYDSTRGWIFGTNTGNTAPVDRWKINNSGNLIPINGDNTLDLGASSAYVRDVYAKGSLFMDIGSVTAAAGAATLNKKAGTVTTENLTTAAGADYTLVLTNSMIAASDLVMVTVGYGTMTAGIPHVMSVTAAAGSVTIVVRNIHASAAFDTKNLKIRFLVLKA